ncbi:MAG: hypothetical protein O7B99_13945 [Planctomycetota bacterium]|nr:hypothetical protein [Planctomycetota bacterium]
MQAIRIANSSGWFLLVGFALCALGLANQPQGGDGQDPTTGGGPTVLTTTPAWGATDSNDRMIAVTGIDVTGSSILFVIDTIDRQLAVYQASGGSESTMGVKFVAGRNIDLDLQVYGYNDKSRYSYRDMLEQFEERAANDDR